MFVSWYRVVNLTRLESYRIKANQPIVDRFGLISTDKQRNKLAPLFFFKNVSSSTDLTQRSFSVMTHQCAQSPVLSSKVIKELCANYSFKNVEVEQKLGGLSSLNYKIKSDGRYFVLKCLGLKEVSKLEKVESMVSLLQEKGWPVPAFMPNHVSKICTMIEDYYFVLYPFVEGVILHEATLTQTALESAGEFLANFHQIQPTCLLANQTEGELEFDMEKIKKQAALLLEKIKKNTFGEQADQIAEALIKIKLDTVENILLDTKFRQSLNTKDLVHGDFHNENLIFDEKHHVKFLLDFESIHLGHRMEDVMRFIQFACFNTGYSDQNFLKAHYFLSAYKNVYSFDKAALRFSLQHSLFASCSSFFLENSLYEQRNSSVIDMLKRDLKKLRYFQYNLDEFLERLEAESGI